MIDADPVAGRNYPKTWVQFQDWFASEDACASYLEKLRWPGGFCCPACGVRDAPVRASRRRLVCRSCTHQCSVTAGTIFDKTRTPLRVWFAAAWQITSQKHGVSALGLQRVLGLSSYQTAWAMLHRFRRAMVRLQREKLAGTVEVDEAYLPLSRGPGVKVKRVSSKAHNNSHLVVIAVAVEVHDPKGFGRIRIHRVQGPTIDALIPFVRENVMPGATIRTDGSAIYGPLKHDGFGHEPFVQLGTDIPAHVSLPGVHRVIAGSPSRHFIAQTVVAWHPSRSCRSEARGLLPRRICVPLQPSLVTIKRNAVLPVVAAIGRNNSSDLRQHTGQRSSVTGRTPDYPSCGAKWIARTCIQCVGRPASLQAPFGEYT